MAAILRDLVAVWDYFEDTGPAPLDGIVARARNLLSGLAGEDGR
jgi:hypothetical protein